MNYYTLCLADGTTFTYLPTKAFDAFVALVRSEKSNRLWDVSGPDPNYEDVCFAGAGTNYNRLADFFPMMTLRFSGNVEITLDPINYLFVHGAISGAYCLGIFDNGYSGSLLACSASRPSATSAPARGLARHMMALPHWLPCFHVHHGQSTLRCCVGMLVAVRGSADPTVGMLVALRGLADPTVGMLVAVRGLADPTVGMLVAVRGLADPTVGMLVAVRGLADP
ncbi:hypothetical protein CYMTET_25083, partial [Cymbomonas tetramitiformis]